MSRSSLHDESASLRKTVRAPDKNLSSSSGAATATHPATKSLRFSIVDSDDKNDEHEYQCLRHR